MDKLTDYSYKPLGVMHRTSTCQQAAWEKTHNCISYNNNYIKL